jgi:hypothetical protein
MPNAALATKEGFFLKKNIKTLKTTKEKRQRYFFYL